MEGRHQDVGNVIQGFAILIHDYVEPRIRLSRNHISSKQITSHFDLGFSKLFDGHLTKIIDSSWTGQALSDTDTVVM